MSINIHYFNPFDISSDEAAAGKELFNLFNQELGQLDTANGDIYIIPSVQLYGQAIRDVDLVIMGSLDGLNFDNIQTRQGQGLLRVNNFIVNIELKSMIHSRVRKDNSGSYYVYYNNTGWHNASEQCRKAKFSLRDHIKDQLSVDLFVVDVLWFHSLDNNQLSKIRGDQFDNALASGFSVKEFFEIVAQAASIKINDISTLEAFRSGVSCSMRDVYSFLTEIRKPQGLTLRKFNLISMASSDLDQQVKDITENSGENFNYLEGRAGTGKTILLLQTAFQLAVHQKKRCKILTYNNALVSDINRLLDYTKIPDGVDKHTVSISTLDSFFQSLLISFGIIDKIIDPLIPNYRKLYQQKLNDLLIKIKGICESEKCKSVKDSSLPLDWDYILVDEAQDISTLEKELFFLLYSPHRLIIADGVDQFVQNSFRQDWITGLESQILSKGHELHIERRQKSNLVRFLNAFAYRASLKWNVLENNSIPGGEIYVEDSYTSDLHDALVSNCKENECENYDILILEPPSLGCKDEDGISHYKYLEDYKDANINIFDGFNIRNRTRYATHGECRLYQYDSCRGLEGWCVVCDCLDDLVEYKKSVCPVDQESLLSEDEQRRRFALLWALIPLTRAIDTLVITLRDPDSEIGKLLKELCGDFSDFAHWNIK